MLTNALKHLVTDRDGEVSFEYVIVGAFVVSAVAAAFNTNATNLIKNALTSGMNTMGTIVTTAVGS
jgi:hypothetical protein